MFYLFAINISVLLQLTFLNFSPEFNLLIFNFITFSILIFYFQNEKIKLTFQMENFLTKLKNSKTKIEQTYSQNLQAAHDLGSPVSAINAVADQLKDRDNMLFEMLERSSSRINEISSGLLSNHKAKGKEISSDFFDIENDISKIIHEKRQEFISIPNLSINYRFTAPILSEVKIPKTDFYRVFSNIINNSIDALESKNDKEIMVTVAPHKSSIEIEITDNGVGIPENCQHEIFIEGHSLKGGTGLGLSYSKSTIRSWGGNITLKKSNSNGTTFVISVPLAE